jgi:hypothetical protein
MRGAIPTVRNTPILQYSKTPSLRSPGFEDDDDDEDENEAPQDEALGWCQHVTTIEHSAVPTTDRSNTPSPNGLIGCRFQGGSFLCVTQGRKLSALGYGV